MGSARETRCGELDIVELIDEGSGQRARILPSVGANCYEYAVQRRGREFHLLEPAPDAQAAADRPTGRGVPILFPFPNRVRGGEWSFQGRSYRFEDASFGGNHIHGLVYSRPWAVQSLESGGDFAACALQFNAADADGVLEQYPFPFQLTASFRLGGGALRIDFSVLNAGERDMPMGLGFHPYFSAPIGPETAPRDCAAFVPADAYWELEELLPTGRILSVSGERDLRRGQPFEGMSFDDLFTAVQLGARLDENGASRCVIEDRTIRLRTVLESGGAFRELVLYTPPGRRALCIEPYTCPTNAVNLEARGVDAGLIVLAPGGVFSSALQIYPEPF